jgi:hypothetical protein
VRSNGQRSEVERLQLYVDLTEQLKTSRLVQRRPDIGLQVNWTPEEGMRTEVQQPEEEELRSFLLTFRKFVSQGEDAYFNAICNIAERRLENVDLKVRLRKARELWKHAMRTGPMGIVDDDDRTITPEYVVDLFINGRYFHNDAQKEAELKRLLPDLVRYQFLAAILDTTKAVFAVGEVIRVALAQKQIRS